MVNLEDGPEGLWLTLAFARLIFYISQFLFELGKGRGDEVPTFRGFFGSLGCNLGHDELQLIIL